MIVCSCNVLSDDEVRTVARTMTRRTASSVYVCLRCRVRCGRCIRTIREIMDDELDQRKGGCQACCLVQVAFAEQTRPLSGRRGLPSLPKLHRRPLVPDTAWRSEKIVPED